MLKIHTPDLEERLGVMIEHIGKMVEYKGEHMAMLQARKLVVGYFKGIEGSRQPCEMMQEKLKRLMICTN